MNLILNSLIPRLVVLYLGVLAPVATAQTMPFAQDHGFNSLLLNLLGPIRGFSAKTEMEISNARQPNPLKMEMDFKFLQGKMRAEIDMANVQSPDLRPAMLDSLKDLGMDRVVTITDPKATNTLVLYPNLKAYILAPPMKPKSNTSRLRKSKLGEKIIQGHLCTHQRITFTPTKEKEAKDPRTIHIWEATDIGNFPLRIKIQQNLSTITVDYVDVNLDLPAATEFSAPSDFKKFPSMEKVMQNALEKLTGEPAPEKP